MKEYVFHIPFNRNHGLNTYKWQPDPGITPAAIIQVVHGMMDHAGRYSVLGRFLADKGYIVVAHDLPGHGRSVASPDDLGHMPGHGWIKLLRSIQVVHNEMKNQYPSLPFFLFGHSMGSVLSRHQLLREPYMYDGLILSGPNHTPALMARLGALLSGLSIRLQGRTHRNRMLSYLVYGKFKKPFKNELITVFDWLSRDKEEVKKYVESDLCGFPCTSGFYFEMFRGFLKLSRLKLSGIRKDLSILIFAGTMDPVGKFGLDPGLLQKEYKKSGVENVQMKLYKEGRHEMINEINREEVLTDIFRWLEKSIRK